MAGKHLGAVNVVFLKQLLRPRNIMQFDLRNMSLSLVTFLRPKPSLRNPAPPQKTKQNKNKSVGNSKLRFCADIHVQYINYNL